MARGTGPAALGGEDAARHRSRVRRWAVALPWVVAAAVGAAALVAAPDTEHAAGSDPDVASDPIGGVDATTAPDPVALPGAVTIEVLAAARRVLGTHGVEVGGGAAVPDRWVLDQVIDPASLIGTGQLDVVVHATVIAREGDGWTGPTTETAVVPVRTEPRPAVSGPARAVPPDDG